MARRSLRAGLAALLVVVLAAAAAGADGAGAFAASKRLRRAVTVRGLVEHLRVFDALGRRYDDTRASGTRGYDRSARYVARKLRRAGYDVDMQRFVFDFFDEASPTVFEQVAPRQVTYEEGVDFEIMQFSGSGDVTGELVAVDLTLPPTEEPSSTSGCEDSDFPPEVEGNIALIQRGTCLFIDKVVNAQEAGAVGVVIFNEGNPSDPTRIELLSGDLGPPGSEIPAIGTTFALGEDLADGVTSGPTGVTVRLATDTIIDRRPTHNVIAETPGGDRRDVVMAGAHLDSVTDGPGINDNGSGSAGVLETALEMAELGIEPPNKVRFAFWAAEEVGLIGSTHYVESLSRKQLNRIDLYLNFDMIGSPNYVRFVYDGDGSAFGIPGPEGSGAIESLFTRYFDRKGLATDETEFNGRSDYQAFITAGIPAGGLFTGAEGIKTPEQEEVYGGQAGEPYDPCYHEFCDDLDNVNRKVLHQMADAIAHAVYTFGHSTGAATP